MILLVLTFLWWSELWFLLFVVARSPRAAEVEKFCVSKETRNASIRKRSDVYLADRYQPSLGDSGIDA